LAFSAASLQPLQRQAVLAQIDAGLLAEFVSQIVDDALVEVLATEEGVAVGRFDFEHAVADLENGNVEGASAKVIDRDLAASLLVEAISKRGCGGFIDDPQHLETGNPACILCRLALGVVEIGWYGNDRLGYGTPRWASAVSFILVRMKALIWLGLYFLAPDLDPGVAIVAGHDVISHHRLVFRGDRVVMASPDQSLDRVYGVFRIGDALALGRLADQHFTVVGEGDHRRRGAAAFGIFNDRGLVSFPSRQRKNSWFQDRYRLPSP